MNNYEFCATWAAQFMGRTLDYGCGKGELIRELLKRGVETYRCDVYYEGTRRVHGILDESRPFIRRMEHDCIPFDDESFDIIVSNQVV